MGRSTRRGPWLPDEDNTLLQLVHMQGPNNWVRISQHMQHRSPKQCRERYHQNLKSSLNHEPISAEEGELIEQLVHEMGKRWAEIARRLGNRSDNAVKNWWNGSMNRRKRSSIQQNNSARGVGPRSGPILVNGSLTASYHCEDRRYAGTGSVPPAVFRHEPLRPSFPHSLPTPDRDCSQEPPRLPLPDTRTFPALSQPFNTPSALEPSLDPFPAHSSLHTPQSSQDYRLAPLDWRTRGQSEKPTSGSAISPAATECSNQQAPSLVSDTPSRCSVSPRTVSSPRPGLPAPIKTSHSYWEHRRRTSYISIGSDGRVYTPLDEGYMSALPTSTSIDIGQRRFPFEFPSKSMYSPAVERRPDFHLPAPKLSPLAEQRDNRMNVSSILG